MSCSQSVCTSAASELKLQCETLSRVTLLNVWEKKVVIIFAVFFFLCSNRAVCEEEGANPNYTITMKQQTHSYRGEEMYIAAQVECCDGRGFTLSSVREYSNECTTSVI